MHAPDAAIVPIDQQRCIADSSFVHFAKNPHCGPVLSAVGAAAHDQRNARGKIARAVVAGVGHGDKRAPGSLGQGGDAIGVDSAVALVEEVDLLEVRREGRYRKKYCEHCGVGLRPALCDRLWPALPPAAQQPPLTGNVNLRSSWKYSQPALILSRKPRSVRHSGWGCHRAPLRSSLPTPPRYMAFAGSRQWNRAKSPAGQFPPGSRC